MIRYLTGSTNPGVEAIAFERDIGLMIQPRNPCEDRIARFPFWAADNGAFTASPGGFDEAVFRALLVRPVLQRYIDRCLFVVAPDRLTILPDGTVRGDASGTLEQFPAWAAELSRYGFPVALVAQDGFEALLHAVPWSLVDVLFLGGSTPWKLSDGARACAAEARHHGKRVHMGRVNSYRRLARATAILADTADGTFLRFAPGENVGRLCGFLDKLEHGVQCELPWRAAAMLP